MLLEHRVKIPVPPERYLKSPYIDTRAHTDSILETVHELIDPFLSNSGTEHVSPVAEQNAADIRRDHYVWLEYLQKAESPLNINRNSKRAGDKICGNSVFLNSGLYVYKTRIDFKSERQIEVKDQTGVESCIGVHKTVLLHILESCHFGEIKSAFHSEIEEILSWLGLRRRQGHDKGH